MSDLLREVDEAMRAERMKRLWEQHGNTVVMVVAALILGTAANSGWKAYKTHQAQKQTTVLIEALKSDDVAAKIDPLTQELKGPNRALASFDAGALALEKQDFDKAIGYYENVIKDKSIPQDLRDLALVQMISIQLDHKTDLSGDDLLKAIAPVSTSEKSSWRPRGLMLSALIKAHKNRDYKGALEDLALLSAYQSLPTSMQAQAQALKEVYSYNLAHAEGYKE